MSHAVISLCDNTGHMVRPWADAGYECWCFDVQHSIRVPRTEGNIHFVWGDARTVKRPTRKPIAAVFAFPPCTHVSVSGTRDHPIKGGQMLRDALEIFEACRQVCEWSGAPYCIENPVGILSSIPHIGTPDFYFDPCDYAGLCEEDNYTKRTCLWTGNGFIMPDPCPLPMTALADGCLFSALIELNPEYAAMAERRIKDDAGMFAAVS
jgi:hypothetical protein